MKFFGSVILGRTFLFLGLALLLGLFCWEAFGEEMSVIEVRKNIPLADSDPVYKDFYLSAGHENLKKNQVVTAVRKMQVRDATGANSYGEIEIPVGQLKVISVFGKVAIAREFKLISRDNEPMLEQIGIMIGDRIDLTDSFVDAKKSK